MRDGSPFPASSHGVFENYINKRFQQDRSLLAERFPLDPDSIRRVAEELAYCMIADPGLGLSPSRDEIENSMQRLGFSRGSEVRLAIDALVFIKLARSEEDTSQSSPSFTFAHRRFQEYFATCLVLRESARVAPSALLQDGRWRETAVTICQTQNHQSILPLIQEADEFLDTVLATTNSPLGVPAVQV